MGVREQAAFDADVRRIRPTLDGLPMAVTLEERRLTLEEAARSRQEMRTLGAVATRAEQRALAQSLFRAVHVDLAAQSSDTVARAIYFRDLLPFIGTPAGEEAHLSPERHERIPHDQRDAPDESLHRVLLAKEIRTW
jgi:hypothetical protein